MKRLIAILLTLILAAGLSAAQAEAAVAGTWYLCTAYTQGQAIYVPLAGISGSLVLDQSGSAVFEVSCKTQASGTWEQLDSGLSVHIGSKTYPISLDEDNALRMEYGDEVLLFRRNAPVTPSFPEERTDVKPEDFNGFWYGRYYAFSQTTYYPDSEGMTGTYVVDAAAAGKDVVIMPDVSIQDDEITFHHNDGTLDETVRGRFDGGAYSVYYDESESSEPMFRFFLLKDGTLACSIMSESNIVMYFMKD